MSTTVYKQIDTTLIDPSKTNPRKDWGDLSEMVASIKSQGIIEPLIVRPVKKRFEIVAGERRYRSAKLAELDKLPCLVREISDEDAIEIQGIENLQRKDLKPLEEAAQYRLLIDTKPDKHSATTIAEKVGKSPTWVWDVMKVLDLVPEAKKLLNAERFTLNHAIPIARLTPEQQRAVIDPQDGGLFQDDNAFDFGNGDKDAEDPYSDVKSVSVRELNMWIAKHIRFDVKQAAKAAPLEFEPIAETVKEAEAEPGRGRKVIPITYDSFLQPSARNAEERTYTVRAWKRADGTVGTTPDPKHYGKFIDSPECEHSVLGTVVTGPEYGKVFKVCVAKDKCEVHWRKQIKEKKSRASGTTSNAQTAQQKQEMEARREQRHKQRAEAHWAVLFPAMKTAAYAKLDKLPANLPKALFQRLLIELDLPLNTKPANLASALVNEKVRDGLFEHGEHWIYGKPQMAGWAGDLGVDVSKLEKAATAELNATEFVVDKATFDTIRNSVTIVDSLTKFEPFPTRTPFVHNGRLMVATGGVFAPKAPKDMRAACYAYELVPPSDFKGKSRKNMTAKLRTKFGPDHGTRVTHNGSEWTLAGPRVMFTEKAK